MLGLSGLLAQPTQARRNIASGSGRHRTDGAQRLLTMARWNEDEARAKLRDLVRAQAGPGGDLYVIEASFAKRGRSAVATERQCSVDSGWIESCQSAILLFYGAADGRLFLIDIDLYVPKNWLVNEDQRRRAKMPPHTVYRSKSRIARDMVDHALALGLDPARVVLSLFCSDKGSLLRWLQRNGTPYLAALTAGEFRDLAAVGPVITNGLVLTDRPSPRRSPALYPTAAYYRAASRRPQSDNDINRVIADVRRVDLRWRSMRRQIRIDRYEVRSWRGWQRHMTLAMAVQIALQLAGH
jgi:SRSO17 transposase